MLHYKACAKINLFLHIKGKLPNKYHELESFTVFSNFADNLSYQKAPTNTLTAYGEFASTLPKDNDNIIIKTLEYFQNNYNIKENIAIALEKNLPIGGGIGGGSSNCAITILAINKLFKLNLSKKQLIEIALKFGADVPVCLHQKSCYFSGIGENITKIKLPNNANNKIPIVLINPKEPLITANVFQKYSDINHNIPLVTANTKLLLKKTYEKRINYLKSASYENFIDFIKQQTNDLTDSACTLNPNIRTILIELGKTNPLIYRMSGSGSTCFAIYKHNEESKEAEKILKIRFPNYWVVSSFIH